MLHGDSVGEGFCHPILSKILLRDFRSNLGQQSSPYYYSNFCTRMDRGKRVRKGLIFWTVKGSASILLLPVPVWHRSGLITSILSSLISFLSVPSCFLVHWERYVRETLKTYTTIQCQERQCFDPPGRPTIWAGSDHMCHTCRPSVTTFQNLVKQNNFQGK